MGSFPRLVTVYLVFQLSVAPKPLTPMMVYRYTEAIRKVIPMACMERSVSCLWFQSLRDGGHTGLSEDYYASDSDFGHGYFSGSDHPSSPDSSHGFYGQIACC